MLLRPIPIALIGLSLLLLALGLAGLVRGEPPPAPKIPAEVRGQPGERLNIRAESAGKVVRWYTPDTALVGASEQNGKFITVTSGCEGTYRLIAWTAVGDEPSDFAECKVVIARGVSPPVPLPPDDPLLTDLRRLYALEGAPDKAKHLNQLAGLYRQSAGFAVHDSIGTVGDLLRKVAATATGLLPPATESLAGVRRRIADHLNNEIGTDAVAELTPALRERAAQAFAKVATILEVLR